jgi:glucokinase
MSLTCLAADAGGTHLRFLLARGDRELEHATLRTADYVRGGIARAALDFLRGEPPPDVLCVACAGVVRDGRYHSQNMPFAIDAHEIAAATGIASVRLVNDLEAAAHGVATLRDGECTVVRRGLAVAAAPLAVLALGTGLGGALRLGHGAGALVLPCEPGQLGYAPLETAHADLWEFAAQELGRAPIVEEIISGPGLERTFRFLEARGTARAPELASAAAISASALARADATAETALRLLVSGLGFAVRNFIVATGALGGVLLTGGMAEKIAAALTWPELERGLMAAHGRELLGPLPITLARSDRLGLDGALVLARRAMASRTDESRP